MKGQLKQMQGGAAQIESGLQQISEQEKKLAEGEKEIQSGYLQYFNGKKTADSQFAAAEQELEQAFERWEYLEALKNGG